MDQPRVASREQWLAARKELLAKEKELTRLRDALHRERRDLPVVLVEKSYVFDGPARPTPEQPRSARTLRDLFAGRQQLIVCHVMFHEERGAACAGCSFTVDNLPRLQHLHARDTSLVLISRARLSELERFQTRMEWTVPWYSSLGSDFNYDYHVTTDEEVCPVEYNYRDKATLERLRQTYHVKGEQPGVSVFVRDRERVLHAYSTYARGLDLLCTTYNYLDLTPMGRGEGWDGMPNLHGLGRHWLRHHDSYGD